MTYIEEQERIRKFEQFFIITFPKVKAFAWKLLKSEDDAEDIAQDVFVKLWSSPEIWENETTWNGYIFAMVRNQIFNFLKHKSVEFNYQEQQIEADPPLYEADIHDQLYAKEIELLVKLTVNNMPEQRKNVFLMSRQKGLSNAEIAEKLGLSIRTVERHLYLALSDLKKIVLFLFISYFC